MPTIQSHSILNSWKEIATYFDRGIRTVQRWEHDSHLPVHRIGKGKRAPVYALTSELKFWLVTAGRSTFNDVDEKEIPPDSGVRKRERQLTTRLHQLAQTLAESSVRHQRQAEALEKNILALRSRFPPRKSK